MWNVTKVGFSKFLNWCTMLLQKQAGKGRNRCTWASDARRIIRLSIVKEGNHLNVYKVKYRKPIWCWLKALFGICYNELVFYLHFHVKKPWESEKKYILNELQAPPGCIKHPAISVICNWMPTNCVDRVYVINGNMNALKCINETLQYKL